MTLKNKIYSKTKYFYEVFFWPLMLALYTIVGMLYFFDWYHTKGFENSEQLALSTLVEFLGISMSILIPILISQGYKKIEQRRFYKFSLSAIWTEIRSNIFNLENIIDNFDKFSIIISSSRNVGELVNLTNDRLKELKSIADLLSSESYMSAVSNNTISFSNSDDLYNSIMNSYENVHELKSRFTLVLGAIQIRKSSLLQLSNTELSIVSINLIRDEIEKSLREIYRNLNKTKKQLVKTKKLIGVELDSLGTKNEEILDKSILPELPKPKKLN